MKSINATFLMLLVLLILLVLPMSLVFLVLLLLRVLIVFRVLLVHLVFLMPPVLFVPAAASSNLFIFVDEAASLYRNGSTLSNPSDMSCLVLFWCY